MKSLKQLSFFGLAILLLTSCAKIFYAPDASSLAQSHKIIAIVPPTVSIAANKKVDAESLKEQQKTESLNFQKEMYAWMLKRKMQGKITAEIQDIETTNAKMKKAGSPENTVSPGELSEIIGVDGIITSNYSMTKPMSEGAAIALGVLFGSSGATNEVRVSMSIHDGKAKKLIWNYDHKFSGGIGSSPARLVDQLMKKASKKMPYMK